MLYRFEAMLWTICTATKQRCTVRFVCCQVSCQRCCQSKMSSNPISGKVSCDPTNGRIAFQAQQPTMIPRYPRSISTAKKWPASRSKFQKIVSLVHAVDFAQPWQEVVHHNSVSPISRKRRSNQQERDKTTSEIT